MKRLQIVSVFSGQEGAKARGGKGGWSLISAIQGYMKWVTPQDLGCWAGCCRAGRAALKATSLD